MLKIVSLTFSLDVSKKSRELYKHFSNNGYTVVGVFPITNINTVFYDCEPKFSVVIMPKYFNFIDNDWAVTAYTKYKDSLIEIIDIISFINDIGKKCADRALSLLSENKYIGNDYLILLQPILSRIENILSMMTKEIYENLMNTCDRIYIKLFNSIMYKHYVGMIYEADYYNAYVIHKISEFVLTETSIKHGFERLFNTNGYDDWKNSIEINTIEDFKDIVDYSRVKDFALNFKPNDDYTYLMMILSDIIQDFVDII